MFSNFYFPPCTLEADPTHPIKEVQLWYSVCQDWPGTGAPPALPLGGSGMREGRKEREAGICVCPIFLFGLDTKRSVEEPVKDGLPLQTHRLPASALLCALGDWHKDCNDSLALPFLANVTRDQCDKRGQKREVGNVDSILPPFLAGYAMHGSAFHDQRPQQPFRSPLLQLCSCQVKEPHPLVQPRDCFDFLQLWLWGVSTSPVGFP